MRRRAPVAALLAIAALFLILNRAAYKGYFQDDEFDNIVMTRNLPPVAWLNSFLTPKLSRDNFRPVGHIFFFAMNRAAGLNFARWIAPIQGLHLLNGLLLWLFLRRLGVNVFGACAGAAFFALNVSAINAYWKPMYVFDVLCTTFCLAALLLYSRGHWLMALAAMWLAYKSKELAIMLPAALSAFEFWFGKRDWRRLVPFFVVSLIFGIQALLWPQPAGNPYALVFTPAACWKTLAFYSSRVFFLPLAGLALLVVPVLLRDRRVWFGVAMMAMFFTPLLFLPGRLYPAYTYLPLTGAAMEIGVLSAAVPPAAALAFFALWIPWNIVQLRIDRRATLTAADQVRIYAGAVMDFSRSHPNWPALAFSSYPDTFQMWGIEAAVHYPYPGPYSAPQFLDENAARLLPPGVRVAFINWDRDRNKVLVLQKDPSAARAAYLKMGPEMPIWQLESGWYGLNDYYRWTEPRATARLRRPPDANRFEMTVNVSPSILQRYGYTSVRLTIDGKAAGQLRFDRPGIETQQLDVSSKAEPDVLVAFDFEPSARFPPDPRVLGAPVVSFGFVRAQNGH